MKLVETNIKLNLDERMDLFKKEDINKWTMSMKGLSGVTFEGDFEQERSKTYFKGNMIVDDEIIPFQFTKNLSENLSV